MSMYGSCKCKNIKVQWQVIDLTLVPRACQCSYCISKGAAYVSKSGSKFEVTIHDDNSYGKVRQGSGSAIFHECTNCEVVVFVTAKIGSEVYGALNANCLVNKMGFSTPIATDFSTESGAEKRKRWRQNWCQPVLITSQGCKAPSAQDAVTGASA